MVKLLLLLLTAALTCSTGCATLFNPKTDFVEVDSLPAGAHVLVDGTPVGQTPTRVEVELKAPPRLIQLQLQGFAPQSCQVKTTVAIGYAAADAALCLVTLVGCVSFIDAVGAWNQLETSRCNVTLVPVDEGHAGDDPNDPQHGYPPQAYPPLEQPSPSPPPPPR